MKIFIVTSWKSLSLAKNVLASSPFIEDIIFLIDNVSMLGAGYKDSEDSDNLIVLDKKSDLTDIIIDRFTPNDFLISFDNFLILDSAVIAKIFGRAINFHPSLLPSYGGINPVSWGLYNNASKWGYSWHMIAKEIDAGKIVYQKDFAIPKEAYQIDILQYCLLGGVRILPTLLGDLIKNKLVAQNSPYKKSYFSFKQQPELRLESTQDLVMIERCQPFSPDKKWRWNIDTPIGIVNLVSQNKDFKNYLRLEKFYADDDIKFFYAD